MITITISSICPNLDTGQSGYTRPPRHTPDWCCTLTVPPRPTGRSLSCPGSRSRSSHALLAISPTRLQGIKLIVFAKQNFADKAFDIDF